VDRVPKESIWILDGSTQFETVLAGGWKARSLWDGICSALREAFQGQSPLLDLAQSASEGSSSGDRSRCATADFFSRPAASTKCPIRRRFYGSHFRPRPESPPKSLFVQDVCRSTTLSIHAFPKVDMIVSCLISFKRV
jgi:hypothetical protein